MMKASGIFNSEYGSALGDDSSGGLVTAKQEACNQKCSAYPMLSPDWNGCILGCFDGAYLPVPGTVPTVPTAGVLPTWMLPGMSTPGASVPPGWTQPGPAVTGWGLPPVATPEQVSCNNECNKSYPLLSPGWIACNSNCFGIAVPPGVTTTQAPPVITQTPPVPGPVTTLPATPAQPAGFVQANMVPIVAGLTVVAVGSIILFGKKKKPVVGLGYMKKNGMGRLSDLSYRTSARLRIRRVSVNSQGYDSGGAYWGVGAPLFEVLSDDGEVRYVRSSSRETVKKEFPNAKFYR